MRRKVVGEKLRKDSGAADTTHTLVVAKAAEEHPMGQQPLQEEHEVDSRGRRRTDYQHHPTVRMDSPVPQQEEHRRREVSEQGEQQPGEPLQAVRQTGYRHRTQAPTVPGADRTKTLVVAAHS